MTAQQVTMAIMVVSAAAAIVIVTTEISTLLIVAVWSVPFFALAGIGTRNSSNKQ